MSGFRKVGHKARRGRKANPVPHKQHRKRGALKDPITRAVKREGLKRRREGLGDEWHE